MKHYFYIGVAEHVGILDLTNRCLKNVKQSGISDHLLARDCNKNFKDFTILSKHSDISLFIKESLLISHYKSVLNKTAKSFAVELFDC